MTSMHAIGPEAVRSSLSSALRVLIGQGRRYSLRQICDATGIGESTLKGYLRGDAEPGLSQFLKLASVLGDAFGSELTRIAGFDLVPIDPDDVSTGEVIATAADVVAEAANTMRSSDRVTHQTEARIRQRVESMVHAGRCWLAERPLMARPATNDNGDVRPNWMARLWGLVEESA